MAAKRIQRYLKGTTMMKLEYEKKEEGAFEGFSDADWGNDLESRRTITDYIFKFAGESVELMQKQPTIALSTTEANILTSYS